MTSHSSSQLFQLYSKHAPDWHGNVTKLGYPDAYAHLFSLCPALAGGAAVLDVGTGSGAFAQAQATFAPTCATFTLMDNNAEMLDAAHRTAASFAQTTTLVKSEIGAPLGQFDRIICAHVIEHLPAPLAALDWFYKSLKPGGHLVMAVSRPHWCTSLIAWKWGHRAFRPAQVRSMLTSVRFEAPKAIPFPAGPPRRTSCGYVVGK